MKTKVLFMAFALIAMVGTLPAQTTKAGGSAKSVIKKSCYVDKNNNNVCDNYENKTCTYGNGTGLRDGSGRANSLQRGNKKGNGYYRNGNAQNYKGPNYIDTNKNGICDRHE